MSLLVANDYLPGKGLGPGSLERLQVAYKVGENLFFIYVCAAGVGGAMIGHTTMTLGSMQTQILQTWSVPPEQLITNDSQPEVYGTGSEVAWGFDAIAQRGITRRSCRSR